MFTFEKVVYISHPQQNKEENKKDIEEIIIKLTQKYDKYLFLSPVHAFGFLYDIVDYYQGLNMCISLLNISDEMWVYGDYQNSIGCNFEIQYCKEHGISYSIKTGHTEGGDNI